MDIVVARFLPFALDFSFLAGVVVAVAGVGGGRDECYELVHHGRSAWYTPGSKRTLALSLAVPALLCALASHSRKERCPKWHL